LISTPTRPARSIASLVTFSLVAVTTVILATAGVLARASYQADQLDKLHARSSIFADQLALGLTLPLWNFDRPTLYRIIDGALRHQGVSALSVMLADDGSTIYSRTHYPDFRDIHTQPPPGTFYLERPISFEGQRIGTAKLWVTTRFVLADVHNITLLLVFGIIAFDVVLILCLYGLLRWIVLEPLKRVQRYALAVSSDPDGERTEPPGALRGELASFQDSLVRMIERLRELNATLEDHVAERTAQLALSNKELQSFSYSVSHDLRAPLRGIDGWSQALLEDCGDKLDARGREYLGRVRSEAQHMGQLIDDMLQFAKVTQSELSVSDVDASALAGAIVARLREREPGREVDCRIEPGIVVRADPGLLDSALTNLLDNAWKFTAKRAPARIELGLTDRDGGRVLYVRDNGAGFDMAAASKLFAPFQRMHRAAEFPGTGVGLATVQRIVHRHGGQIAVESAVERGTTFFLKLELAI
jgi:signal transduction histidine kinase